MRRLSIVVLAAVFIGGVALFIDCRGRLSTVSQSRPESRTLPDISELSELANPKVKAILAMWAAANAQPQNFYGKAVDQDGNPVEGVTVKGTLMKIQGPDVGTKKTFYTTHSDANGDFEFTGLHGWQLGVVIHKKGYEMKEGVGFYEPPNKEDKTSPTERAIFHMWKLKGAEALIAYSISEGIPYDGTTVRYDVRTGRRVSVGGGLLVTLTRNPRKIQLGKPFDWSLTLTISGGGLAEIKDLYPNEAPTDGYESTITFKMPKDAKKWTPEIRRNFYVKTEGGNFGTLEIHLMTDYPPPTTQFEAWVLLNPTPGDRNLEYDPQKAIKPAR